VLGVETTAPTAQAASTDCSTTLNAVIQALRRAGVQARDLQTQALQLTARYKDGSSSASYIVGYQATSTVQVTVRNQAQAGALLDLAVASGANVVRGVSFGLQDPTAAQRQARDAALKALQQDAVTVAAALHQRVVRLISVSTSAYAAPSAQYDVEELVVTASRIEPGEVSVRGGASGVFELAPQ
jgi:uncharacterized protein YggE